MLQEARYAVHQWPVVKAMGKVVLASIKHRIGGGAGQTQAPGPEISETVPPRPSALVRDYIRWAGGDPAWYHGALPPHLFPQWCYPTLGRTVTDVSYPVDRILNAGCRMEILGPIPDDKELTLTGRLEELDDNGRRVLLHERVTTSTPWGEDVMNAHVFAIIPLSRGGGGRSQKKERPMVPADARELERWNLPVTAGFEYACFSGDFNPVHWNWPYARAFGFRSVILHGFATLARAIEGLNRQLFDGDWLRLKEIEVRFTRPLALPRKVGLYVLGEELAVGDGPGAPAYLTGTFTTAYD
jgi:hypothetical protein